MQNSLEPSTTTANPWAQQPGEKDAEYAAFLFYLSMPLPRRVVDMEGRINYSQTYLRELSAKWKWRNRAQAYEIHDKQSKQISHHETILMLQDKIIEELVGDLNNLLQEWRKTVREIKKPTDFQRMVQSRLTIDNMFRRAAEMPGNYLPMPTTQPQAKEDEVWELDLPDGKTNAGKITATPQVSDSDLEASSEIQSLELWSALGEEFSGEE
jgi:hypothetical protein